MSTSEKGEVQTFGISCPACKQFVTVGKVYIGVQAPPARSHAKLQEIGWRFDLVTCENTKCGSKTFVQRDQTFLKVRA
jgi:hypothetical protein